MWITHGVAYGLFMALPWPILGYPRYDFPMRAKPPTKPIKKTILAKIDFNPHPDAFDIFVDCTVPLKKIGERPKFLIYKGGRYLTTRTEGYGFEQLQREYGGGDFKIVCKTLFSNEYFKQQTIAIAAPRTYDRRQLSRPTHSKTSNVSLQKMMILRKIFKY